MTIYHGYIKHKTFQNKEKKLEMHLMSSSYHRLSEKGFTIHRQDSSYPPTGKNKQTSLCSPEQRHTQRCGGTHLSCGWRRVRAVSHGAAGWCHRRWPGTAEWPSHWPRDSGRAARTWQGTSAVDQRGHSPTQCGLNLQQHGLNLWPQTLPLSMFCFALSLSLCRFLSLSSLSITNKHKHLVWSVSFLNISGFVTSNKSLSSRKTELTDSMSSESIRL